MPTVKASKIVALQRLLAAIEAAQAELRTVRTDYNHTRIIDVRLMRSEGWLRHVRSAAFDGVDHAKKYDPE